MRTMIRRDPITGLYENVPVPDQTEENNNSVQTEKSSVKYTTAIEKPPRGKP